MHGVEDADVSGNKLRAGDMPGAGNAPSSPMRSFDPERETAGNIYKLMIGSIVPRPIAFVSTLSATGVPNVAPFSYFTAVGSDPPMVLFCPAFREADEARRLPATKDTLRNVIATREFVINIVSEEIAERMNACSAQLPPDVDEFALSGLTPVASEVVKPPRVGESPVHYECRLKQVIETSEKPGGGTIVLGEVLRLHLREDLLHGYRVDPDALRAIGRMGGPTYCRTRDRFDLQRPK